MRSHLDERSMTLHRSDGSSVSMLDLMKGSTSDHTVTVLKTLQNGKVGKRKAQAPAHTDVLTRRCTWWFQPLPTTRLTETNLEKALNPLPCETVGSRANVCTTIYGIPLGVPDLMRELPQRPVCIGWQEWEWVQLQQNHRLGELEGFVWCTDMQALHPHSRFCSWL